MLCCEAMTFRYEGGEADAVQEVTVEVVPGEVLGIAGRSGCGKSTLLRCLAGQLVPQAGTLEADGERFGVSAASRRAYRRRIGLAFQLPERQLFAETVLEDVAFGPRNLGLEGSEAEGRARWALEAVGLDPERFGGRSPFSLSGGEARRAAIAGVIALRPSYLLLDEPTAGLDPREGERLLGLLTNLTRRGMGIAFVSHDVDAIARVCTRVVLMREGRVVRGGPTAKVLGDGPTMRSCGLLPPVEVELAEGLRKRGLAIPDDALTARQIAEALGVLP